MTKQMTDFRQWSLYCGATLANMMMSYCEGDFITPRVYEAFNIAVNVGRGNESIR